MFRAILVTLSLLFLFACSSGSSGGRGGDSGGPQKPDPDPSGNRYKLAGQVSGLQGQLILSNGIDDKFAVVVRDGPFEFPSGIPSGQIYNVRIEAKPEDHICEIANSRSLIIRDTDTLRVRCAKAVERAVTFVRPANIPLNRLVLSSNYQRIGAGTQTPLQEQNNVLQVFNNSYVSLSVMAENGLSAEPIYIVHVNDMLEYLSAPANQRKPVVLDADSTAQALVLLEPSVATALLQRVHPLRGNLQALLKTVFTKQQNATEYQELRNKIHALVTARKTLINNDSELKAPTHALVRKVIASLVEDPTLALTLGPIAESVQGSGVTLAVNTTEGMSTLTAENQTARHVSITTSDRFPTLLVNGREAATSRSFAQLPAQSSLSVKLSGPGISGQVTNTSRNAFVDAVVRSGVEEQFFPALNLALGLQDPIAFNLRDCFDADRRQTLTTSLRSAVSGNLGVSQYEYSPTYNAMFDQVRSQLLGAQNASLLQDIFACNKFGVGTYLEDKLSIARNQVRDVIGVAKRLYEPAGNSLAPFAEKNLTALSASIAATNVETDWVYSNRLVVRLTADRALVLKDEPIEFQATCVDPGATNTAPACDIEWDFGDGTKKASQAYASGTSKETHRYMVAGEYRASVTAKRAEGATVSQTVNISVRPPIARIEVRKFDGTLLTANQVAHDFGQVLVNARALATIKIANTGNVALSIGSITVNEAAFSVQTSSLQVPPGQSRDLQVAFEPTAERDYAATLTILSNDSNPNSQMLTLMLKGRGYLQGKPATGGWTVERDGVSQTFVVQRAVLRSGFDNGLAVRIFGEISREFPQIILAIPGYRPGQSGTFKLDDVGAVGCNGSVVLDRPENSFCTNTSDAVSTPLTGTVEVVTSANGQLTLNYKFRAGLNAITCGTPDVSQCDTIFVEGTALVNAQ